MSHKWEIISLFFVGLLFLIVDAWLEAHASAVQALKQILSSGGGACIVAAISALVISRILKKDDNEEIITQIANKFDEEYSREVDFQLLSNDFIRDYVRCLVSIRETNVPGWILAEVEYEYVCTNITEKEKHAEIRYNIEKKLGTRGYLRELQFSKLDDPESSEILQRDELSPYRQKGAFGENYVVRVDVQPKRKLWAKTSSVELHPESSEIYLACFQPSLAFTVNLRFEKKLLDKLEFAPEFLHPRVAGIRSPERVKDEGDYMLYSYKIDYPCLPYQGIKLFFDRRDIEVPAFSLDDKVEIELPLEPEALETAVPREEGDRLFPDKKTV